MILPILVAGFILATVVAPFVDQRRRNAAARRRELSRCGGRITRPTPPPPPPITFYRPSDPSPRPRRRQDA